MGIAKMEGDRHTAFTKIQKSRDPAGIKNLAGIIKIHRISPENPKSVQSKSGWSEIRNDRISDWLDFTGAYLYL